MGAGPPDGDELERLRRENQLLNALLEGTTELVDVLEPSGTLIRTFRKRDRLLGYDPEEIQGRSVLDLLHPEDRPVAKEALAQLAVGPGARVDVRLRVRAKDGRFVPIDCQGENRTHDAEIRGVVVVSRDVSQRVELEEKLRIAQRTESVGRLASGIVHDFNNLLAIIRLAASRASASPETIHGALDAIVSASERGASLTKRLLSFVRGRQVNRRVFDLAPVVVEMTSALTSLLPEELDLELSVQRDPLHVCADPTEIEHVLINLVLNARDAMQRGVVKVEVSRDGDAARIDVIDRGDGMDEDTKRRAFEPFFTTKAAEQGTGLGLWAVRDVVTDCGGSIELETSPGTGTSAVVRLPLVERAVSTPPHEPSPEAGRKLSILVVEDEPRLRMLLADALAAAGHDVETAADGVAALDMVEQDGMEPDALVTDVRMPRLGGPALARRLRDRFPGVAVVFASGYDEPEDVWTDERTATLAKPFSAQRVLDELLRMTG